MGRDVSPTTNTRPHWKDLSSLLIGFSLMRALLSPTASAQIG